MRTTAARSGGIPGRCASTGVGGPASTAAWGVVLTDEATERHTRYCVRLFLHGALPAQGSGVIERENRRIKAMVEDAARELGRACETLKQISTPQN